MVQTQSPGLTNVVSASVRAAVDEHRAQMERERRMPRPLVEVLRAAGAFRLSTPIERGGLELPLADALRVLEEFGRLDAAVAWNVWNGSMGFSAAMLTTAGVDAIWGGSRDPIIVNSARPAGVAARVANGYELSGRWDIVSGVDNADWLALFGIVGAPSPGGRPDIRVFYVPRDRVEIVDTWQVLAMRGTGSNSVVVDGVLVSEDLVLSPFAPARIDRPLFRIPAFTLASTGAAAVVVGVAQAALEAVVELVGSKRGDDGSVVAERSHVQADVGSAQISVHAARLALYDATAEIDAAAVARRPVDDRLRAQLRAAMSHAARTARDALLTAYALASSSALYAGSTVERCFRDGLAAAQHAILSETHLTTYGRVVLGRPAGVAVL